MRGEADLSRPGGLAEKRILVLEAAVQFFFEGEHPERTNRVGTTGFEPRVFAENQGGDGLFTIFDFGTNEAIGEVRALLRRNPAIEQRHEY